MIKPIGGLLVVGALSLFAMPSHASLYCDGGQPTEGITESNMTYDGAAASDCYGVVTGNIYNQTDLDGLIGDVWGTGWQHLVQGDETEKDSGEGLDTGTFGGYEFTLTWDGTDSGNWTLSATGSPLPASFDIVAGLKGANKYALWYFPSISVDTTATSGMWEISFTNQGGNNPDLSHLTLFARDGIGVTVPEPTTLGLLGLGLLGLAAARRRR